MPSMGNDKYVQYLTITYILFHSLLIFYSVVYSTPVHKNVSIFSIYRLYILYIYECVCVCILFIYLLCTLNYIICVLLLYWKLLLSEGYT